MKLSKQELNEIENKILMAYTLTSKQDGIFDCTDEQLFEMHDILFNTVVNSNCILVDGVEPVEFRKQRYDDNKSKLYKVETVLRNRDMQIPSYGLIKRIKRILLGF